MLVAAQSASCVRAVRCEAQAQPGQLNLGPQQNGGNGYIENGEVMKILWSWWEKYGNMMIYDDTKLQIHIDHEDSLFSWNMCSNPFSWTTKSSKGHLPWSWPWRKTFQCWSPMTGAPQAPRFFFTALRTLFCRWFASSSFCAAVGQARAPFVATKHIGHGTRKTCQCWLPMGRFPKSGPSSGYN